MKKKLVITAGAVFSTFILAIIGYLFIIYAGDYVIDEKKLVMNSATKLVDENGKEITKLYVENRDLVSITEVPKHVQEAFISVEDARFYQHAGIDIQAILRALYKDILAGSKIEGGSTITQQLAKNIFLTNEKTLLRKTKELIISINLEKKYSKNKLLEMYLNQIYFGHGVYGVQAASKLYFNKEISQLTIEEGALIAGIPKAPTTYSPILEPNKSKERRNLILSLMAEKGYINPEQAVRAQGKTLGLAINQTAKNPALLTYIDMVFDEAERVFSISNEELLRGGYTITVPLNQQVQETAYKLFQDASNFPGNNEAVEGAFVLMDQKTGGVIAAIGGRNYVQKGINRVNVKRQPGSTLKPLAVYGPAIEEKVFFPYSLLVDEKRTYGTYTPENYNHQYQLKMTMYDALVQSANAPAVWTLNELGIETGKKYLQMSGLQIPDQGLAVALGGLKEGISPLNMMKAYRAFVANGNVIEPHFITKITARDHTIIGEAKAKERKVFSKQTSWYISRMLEGVVNNGSAKSGYYPAALAGKTGTTNDPNAKGGIKDVWFVGFTPSVVGAVWMGYDRTDESHYLTGGSVYPTALFKKILNESPLEKEVAFSIPGGVHELEEPIRLKAVTDLQAELTFKPLSLFTINLQWTPSKDKRVQYHIYEKQPDSDKYIGTVTGKGSYQVNLVNLFSLPSLYVVPYNSLTDEEGERSNTVTPAILSRNSMP